MSLTKMFDCFGTLFLSKVKLAFMMALATMFLFDGMFYSYLLLSLLTTKYAYLSLLYFTWMIYDRNTCNRGGRLQRWVRELKIWKLYADYFPIRLHKTVDLDSNRNYMFIYHPHGIIGYGAVINFGTEATGFSKLFPGITIRPLTLNINYWIPIARERPLLFGICSVNKESIEYILTKMGKGQAVLLVVGGASEALDAIPNRMDLTLKDRKGFVRLAIQTGSSLVPCISFGENEIFSQTEYPEGSFVKKFQRGIQRLTTFTVPFIHGRGLFLNNFGFFPYQKPIHTVVGEPLSVSQNLEPSEEEVDFVHQNYMNALEKLFEENKLKYAEDPNIKIKFK